MKSAVTSVVAVVFAGVLFSSLLNFFDGNFVGRQMDEQQAHYPYYMSY